MCCMYLFFFTNETLTFAVHGAIGVVGQMIMFGGVPLDRKAVGSFDFMIF